MGLIDHDKGGFGLLIGDDHATGRPQYYEGQRCLATIAPPESGKTQCHIEPALLTWRGPAIVLDVTGNLWRRTSKFRSQIGPVYKIDPDHPAESDHYNPFDYIRTDPELIWGDAQTFAQLLYSRQGSDQSGSSSFFNLAAPDYLAALACFILTKKDQPYRHNCETLLRLLTRVSADAFCAEAEKSTIVGLQTTAGMVKRSDKDTRANVEYTAKNCLNPWANPQTASISRVSDWHPAMIRAHNATVYICVSLERLKDSPGFVRLLIGQHLTEFMRYEVDGTTPWVQLFVDEAPQLRHMDVLLRAIEVGRNYRVRMWMAMQWAGQLTEVYGDKIGLGMIGACGLQAYMNPPLGDGTAESLSKQIGSHRHRLDQTERPFVTPQALAGSDYKNDVIAFDYGNSVRLRKHFCHEDAALSKKTGASP